MALSRAGRALEHDAGVQGQRPERCVMWTMRARRIAMLPTPVGQLRTRGAAMSDDDRRAGPEGDAGDADRRRRSREAADDDRDAGLAGADGDGEAEDTTLMRARPHQPHDDDETTKLPAAKRQSAPDEGAAADPAGDREDTTQIRRGAFSSDAAGEGDDATRQRDDLEDATPAAGVPTEEPPATLTGTLGDDEATAVNVRTQSMPAAGRTSLGPAPDAPRLNDEARSDEATGATDATYLRDVPDASRVDATRLRARSLPGDDEATQIGADLGDDDATLQSPHVPPNDEETIRASMRGAPGDSAPAVPEAIRRAPDDADLTMRASGALDVAGPAVSDASPAIPSSVRAAKEVGPGTVLKGRFTLEDKLGAGGMGGVYRAVDLVKKEARDRKPYVAVKVLNEAFAEHEDSFLALQRESSRSQRLTHPNIAAVYDFDRDGETAYMVMELLEGSPLDSFLKKKRGGLDPDEAREVIRDIASALGYAHTQTPALVHSDFKPGNIFYTDEGAAKVFDFGIARAAVETSEDVAVDAGMDVVSAEDDDDRTLFDAGKLGALTPAYASLEMFEGRDPAPQDDVYALGIVAYQCFTGRHPFDRQKAPIAAAQNMVPERPPGVTSREWRAIRHALQFKREDRTPDAQAFLDEFFHTGTRTLLTVAATAATMAIGIGALYATGIIGPRAPTPNPNQDWVALQSEIGVARVALRDQLDTGAAGFERNDRFVAWEQGVRSSIEELARVSAPTVRVAGAFEDEAAALRERDRIFELSGAELSLVARSYSVAGPWRVEAGPFRYLSRVQLDAELAKVAPDPRARTYAERRTLDEFVEALAALDIEHAVLNDDARIDAARFEALQTYLREIDRRLRNIDEAIEPIEPRLLYRGSVAYREGTDVPLAPGDARVDALLEEGAVWIADQDELAEWAAAEVALEQAGLDEEESLLARARSRYARALAQSDAPTAAQAAADIEARRRAVRARYEELEAGRQAATVAASALQTAFNTAKTNAERAQRRLDELRAVLQAHLDGGVVEIDAAYGRLGRAEPFTFVSPGLKPAFRVECTQPLVVARALADYVTLPGLLELEALRGEGPIDADRERLISLQYLTQCMNSVIRASSQGEETVVLDVPRAVAGNPAPRLLERAAVRVDLRDAGVVDVAVREDWIFDCGDAGLCMEASDAIFLTRDLVLGTLAHVGEAPSAEDLAAADPSAFVKVFGDVAALRRPDPCAALGYVGMGRDAFCRDTWLGGAAPPVVVIDGPGAGENFAIGKFEVSIGEYNQFARATTRPELAGESRLPATGVSFEDAEAFTRWLSRTTGHEYRLPRVWEWRHAAAAGGSPLDPNRNCYSSVRGVIRGDAVVSVGRGAPNAWGLVNHVGNVEEWALSEEGRVVLGGRFEDPLAECQLTTMRDDDGMPGEGKGFRVLREIRSAGVSRRRVASAAGE